MGEGGGGGGGFSGGMVVCLRMSTIDAHARSNVNIGLLQQCGAMFK